jgi:hypothetical protein
MFLYTYQIKKNMYVLGNYIIIKIFEYFVYNLNHTSQEIKKELHQKGRYALTPENQEDSLLIA